MNTDLATPPCASPLTSSSPRSVAYRIWEGNRQLAAGDQKINLKGLAVGNGLTDPGIQYKWYGQMAYNNTCKIISPPDPPAPPPLLPPTLGTCWPSLR